MRNALLRTHIRLEARRIAEDAERLGALAAHVTRSDFPADETDYLGMSAEGSAPVSGGCWRKAGTALAASDARGALPCAGAALLKKEQIMKSSGGTQNLLKVEG